MRGFIFSIIVIAVALSGTVQAKPIDLAAQLKLCHETYMKFWRPILGEDRDYCHVFANDGDVSDDRGVQWDVIDVIHSASNSLAKVKHQVFRHLAVDLAQCVDTYPRDGRASTRHPDWCLVTPSAATSKYFNRVKDDYSSITYQWSLPNVLEAAWHALQEHRQHGFL